MATNSASGGYLYPAGAPSPVPLEGKALLRFFQQIIVGITGLDGTLVRPYWQEEPPDIPDAGDAWMAFKISKRPADEFPYVGFDRMTTNYQLQRHEELYIHTTAYDAGSIGTQTDGDSLADYYAALLRDGLAIPQNREVLQINGMGIGRINGETVTLPVVFKSRWQNRVDFEFTVRRQITRIYPVLTIVSASGDINYDNGLPAQPFKAP